MQVTITTLSDEIFALDVSEDMELENFKALCESETGISSSQMALVWNGRPLHDNSRKLHEYGIKNGDVLLIQRIQGAHGLDSAIFGTQSQSSPMIDFSSIQVPSTSGAGLTGNPLQNPAAIRSMLLANPHSLSMLKERNPPLAEALLSGSLERFTEVLRSQQTERSERDQQRIRLLNADPFDPDVQKQIAEEIRLKNVDTNMETAMEYAPESFGQVAMLYIDCKVNGHEVKAFVDSGAQMTIMSQACAERCGIMRLVDTRWAGLAKGVGTQKIIGRVHLCQMQIGNDFLQTSFSILENQPMDMLLGLDMLRRHQCSIDLKNNLLVIGTTGKQTPFLSEAELPEHARLNFDPVADEDHQLAEALSRSAQEASSGNSRPSSSSASTSGAAAGDSTNRPNQSQSSRFPERDILKITTYGFSRTDAIEELEKCRGNVDQALVALYAKSFHVP